MLKRMIAAEPDKKSYWQQLWSVYGQQEQYANALVIMELAAHAGLLTESEEYTRMADQMMYVGLPYRAATTLTTAVEQKKIAADAKLYEKIGNAWLAAKEFERAIGPLEQSYGLSGDAALAVRIGEIRMQDNRWDKAEQAFRRALAKGGLGNRHNAELLLGITLYSQDKLDEARAQFEQAAQGGDERQIARGYLRMIEMAR
jgi:tetratricopeptide (TPR) repeat protein